jgi:hypothetical protein
MGRYNLCNGTDPAITGEPSEEQLIQPSRAERVGPSSPEVSGAQECAQAGWYRGARAPRDVVPVPERTWAQET